MTSTSLADIETSAQITAAYHYLLLGELRSLLEEPSENDETRRWLLAVLDRLLARLPRKPVDGSEHWRIDQDAQFAMLGVQIPWTQKLRRLRDRIAHRMPFQILANEIRCDLRLLFDQQLSLSGD